VTINQGAADDEAFALKSSDVAHGRTGIAETDTFASFKKSRSGTTGGGLLIQAVAEDGSTEPSFHVMAEGGTPNTDKDTSASGSITFVARQHNDANGLTAFDANGNVFAITCRLTTGSDVARFVVDAEGDLFSVVANTITAFDNYDDAQLVRALDHAKDASGLKGIVKDKWDDFLKYNEQDLIDIKILGDTVENGGLLNVTQLQRLHNGAIWQGYVRQQEMQEKIDTLENRLLAIEGAK